jgi:ElaB/YqjD/DUF883 family membrane-anchored ribosome-binding protein
MMSEKQRAQAQQDSVDATGSNGVSHAATAAPRVEALATRAIRLLAKLPSTVDAQLKEHPYRTVGVASAVGIVAGVLLSNRILRTVFANAAAVAIVQLGRAYLLREVEAAR